MKKLLVVLMLMVTTFTFAQKQEEKKDETPKVTSEIALAIRNKQIDQLQAVIQVQSLQIQQLQNQIQIMQKQSQSQNLSAEIATMSQEAPGKQNLDSNAWELDLKTLEYKKREIKSSKK